MEHPKVCSPRGTGMSIAVEINQLRSAIDNSTGLTVIVDIGT